MRRQSNAILAVIAVLTLAAAQPTDAQNRSIFLVGGYGTTTYEAAATKAFPNDFRASVSPVILYTMGRDVIFETELEFGLSGAATTTTLEYAQIDYLGFEKVQIIAGKFLVPFGIFGERLHPTWINKLPSAPVLFGHAHGGVAESGLLPIMSDAGLMVRWAQPVGSTAMLDFSGYVTQGPRLAPAQEDDHAGDEHDPTEPDDDHAPPVAFGTSFTDNNTNKMVGARLGIVKGSSFEAYVSGFHSMYDEDNFLDYTGGLCQSSGDGPGSNFAVRRSSRHRSSWSTRRSRSSSGQATTRRSHDDSVRSNLWSAGATWPTAPSATRRRSRAITRSPSVSTIGFDRRSR